MRIMEHHVLKNVKKPKQQGRTSWKDKDELSGGGGRGGGPNICAYVFKCEGKSLKRRTTN